MRGEWQQLRSPVSLVFAVGLAVVVVLVFATTTTTAAFGVYNPAWDGASDLEQEASVVDSKTRLALNTTVYETASPGDTIAVVLTPDQTYRPQETARVRQFVENGGTLVVAEDFGPHSNALLRNVGATTRVDGRLLRDERHYYRSPNITIANDVTPHPFTTGVDQMTFNHGTSLRANTSAESETQILVNSSSFAYLDGNRNAEFDSGESLDQRPVATVEPVGDGQVIVVGDPSMMINAMLERPGNRAFVRNLFSAHERVILDYSHAQSLPPLSYALVVVRNSGLLQVIVGVLGIGLVALGVRWPNISKLVSVGEEPASLEIETLICQLRTENPDWDADRLERVAKSRLRNGDLGGDDE